MIKRLSEFERILRDYIIIVSIVLVLAGVASLGVASLYKTLGQHPTLSLLLNSLGGTLFTLGIVGLIFRTATARIAQREIMRQSVEVLAESLWRTYVPRLTYRSMRSHGKIVDESGTPFLYIIDTATVLNNYPDPVVQKSSKVEVDAPQQFRLLETKVLQGDIELKLLPNQLDLKETEIFDKATGKKTVAYSYTSKFPYPLGEKKELAIEEHYGWGPIPPPGEQEDGIIVETGVPIENMAIVLECAKEFYFTHFRVESVDTRQGIPIATNTRPSEERRKDGKRFKISWELPKEEIRHDVLYKLTYGIERV